MVIEFAIPDVGVTFEDESVVAGEAKALPVVIDTCGCVVVVINTGDGGDAVVVGVVKSSVLGVGDRGLSVTAIGLMASDTCLLTQHPRRRSVLALVKDH